MSDLNPINTTAVFNPLPRVIVVLVLAMVIPEIVLQLADRGYIGGPEGIGWRTEVIRYFGFFDSIFEYMRQTETYDWNTLRRFVTYPFVNLNIISMAFGTVLTLALGKKMAEHFSWWAVLVLYFTGAIASVSFAGVFFDDQYPIVGGMGPVYGLLGGYSWMMFMAAGSNRKQQLMAFRIVIFLSCLNLFFSVFFGGGYSWIGFIAGFVVGFGLSYVMAPDARQRIAGWVNYLRKR